MRPVLRPSLWVTSPAAAIAFGTLLICAEACRHFDAILGLPDQFLQLPIHDWSAGGYLIYAGRRSRHEVEVARPHLLAAWAFNASLLWGALLSHLEDMSTTRDTSLLDAGFIGAIALMLLVALGGWVAAMRSVRQGR